MVNNKLMIFVRRNRRQALESLKKKKFDVSAVNGELFYIWVKQKDVSKVESFLARNKYK